MPTRRTLLTAGAAATVAMAAGTAPTAPAAAAPARTGGTGQHGRPDAAALQAALDRVVATGTTAALARFDGPAGSWRGASGVTELGRPVPAPADGRFRIGSITKTFVATVLLQLVGERRISLDDTLERWLPGALPDGARITVRQLMQHTSGVYNYTDDLLGLEWFLANRLRTLRPQELVAIAARHPLNFEPGQSWSYSNTNYVLLGLIMQRVTGRPYGVEVATRILAPLRLLATEVPGTDPRIRGPHAHGYLAVDQGDGPVPVDVTELNPSMAFSAGEMISTTADLGRFLRALLRGRLLRPAQLAAMLANPAGELGYGLGIYRQPLPGGPTLLGHSGGIPGYVSLALSTADGASQFTFSANPWLGDFDPALIDLLLLAFGVPAPAGLTAAAPLRLAAPDRVSASRGW